MNIEVTYIFHNCFVVRFAGNALLFDYPAAEYLNEAIQQNVAAAVRDTELTVLASHFHGDHFNRQIATADWPSQSKTLIISKDIAKKNRQFREMESCHIVEPDQTYQIGAMDVETFLSNDEGVAFSIRMDGVNIYFGGDLANWAWEDNTNQEKVLLEDHFGKVLDKVKKSTVHIGFSNTDPRLNNWSGARQFMDTVQPQLFVPMHLFGKTELISRFIAQNPGLKTPLFIYEKGGDSISLELT